LFWFFLFCFESLSQLFDLRVGKVSIFLAIFFLKQKDLVEIPSKPRCLAFFFKKKKKDYWVLLD